MPYGVSAKDFGFADTASHVAATPDAIYRAGSISKGFTTTAVMQLVEHRCMNNGDILCF
jgi:CubicO group peptidase (beta-lactamase class C family)